MSDLTLKKTIRILGVVQSDMEKELDETSPDTDQTTRQRMKIQALKKAIDTLDGIDKVFRPDTI